MKTYRSITSEEKVWMKNISQWFGGKHATIPEKYNDILNKHYEPLPSDLPRTFITRIMGYECTKFAAEVRNHVYLHLWEFHRLWKEIQKDDAEDPFEAIIKLKGWASLTLKKKIYALWRMRKAMENYKKKKKRKWAILPEAKLAVTYFTVDRSIAALICDLFKTHDDWNSRKPAQFGEWAFNEMFDMGKIKRLFKKKDFNFMIQTDGYGAAVYFAKTIVPSTSESISSEPPEKHLLDLEKGIAWNARKTRIKINSLDELRGTTVRAIDPGVINTYCSVDMLQDVDVRETSINLKTSSWRNRTKMNHFAAKQTKWYETSLSSLQKKLKKNPFCTSSSTKKFRKYVDIIYENWVEIWEFYSQLKIRKNKFRSKRIQQRELDREVDKLCKPREKGQPVILLMGHGASLNCFGRTRRHVKGPCKRIFDQCVRRKKAVTIWADEFRTSMIGFDGTYADSPPEKKEKSTTDGTAKSGRKTMYQVRYSDKSKRSIWNRDTFAAVNIGCRFLASALGLNLSLWERDTTTSQWTAEKEGYTLITEPKGWDTIFHHHGGAPFTIIPVKERRRQSKE